MSARKNKQRTYARNRFVSRKGNPKYTDSDAVFITKLVVVLLLGSFWVKFQSAASPEHAGLVGLPVGLVLGLFLIWRFEQSPFNRRLWYAIIILATTTSLFLPAGIII